MAKVSYPFAALPNQICRGGHGPVHIAVLAVLLSHGRTSASAQTLAREIGCDRKSVFKSLKYWREEGPKHGIYVRTGERTGCSTVIEVTPGSGGGGGGGAPGGSGDPTGSGGGGGGGAGGYLFCAIRRIQGSITFEAKGGNGGNGGTASSGTVPKSGGGGGGGNGGFIFLMCDSASGHTTDVAGGTGGTGGSASGGTVGSAGSSGNAGTVIMLQLT